MNKKTVAIICSYLLIVVDIAVGIIFVPFLLKGLGDEEYGLYKLLFSTASYLAVLDFGIGSTITRYVVKFKTENKAKEEQNFIAMGMLIYLLLSALVMILAIVLTFVLPVMYQNSISADKVRYAQIMFLLICVNTAVNLFNHAYNGLLSAYEAFVYTKVINIVKVLLRVALIIVGISLKASAFVIVFTDLGLSVLLLLSQMFFAKFQLKIKIKLHQWDGKLAKETFIFTLAILGQSVINQFNSNVDNVVIGIFLSTDAVAVYSIALQLYIMYSTLSTAISTVYFPVISKAVFNGESDDEITNKVIEPSRMQLAVLLLALTGFFVFGMDFITLWVGAEYHIVYIIGMILLTSSTLELSQNTVTSVLKAKNIFHGQILILGISTLCNVILTCILVPIWGLVGAAIGTAFSMVFGYGLASNIYYQKRAKVNIKMYFQKTFNGILPAALLAVPVGILLAWLIPCSNYLYFALEAGCYVLVYGILLLTIGLNKNEKEKLFGRFIKRKAKAPSDAERNDE